VTRRDETSPVGLPGERDPADPADPAVSDEEDPGARRRERVRKLTAAVLAVAVLVLVPVMLPNPTITSIGVFTLIFMTGATAWNGFNGYSGYVSLGHAAFYGTGAYAFAMLAKHVGLQPGYSLFALVPLAGLVAGVVAIPFGVVALRTRRHQFVIVTIAVFFVFQLLAYNLSWLGGSLGLFVSQPSWPGETFNDRYYYAALVVLVLTVALYVKMRNSRFGLQLCAIRDDEDRALSVGVHVGRVKLVAFVISAIPVGMVGAIYAYFVGQVLPQFAFDPLFDVAIAVMCFTGGMGTLTGPLIGALLLEPLQQYITLQFSASAIYLVVYGALFLLVILFLPRGLIPTTAQAWRARRSVTPEEPVELGAPPLAALRRRLVSGGGAR